MRERRLAETFATPAARLAAARGRRDGLIRIWLDCKVVDELGRLCGPGESYSDVILGVEKATSWRTPPGQVNQS